MKEFLKELGFSSKTIVKIINSNNLSNHKDNTLKEKIISIRNYLLKLGLNIKEIDKMIRRFPDLCGLLPSNIEHKIKLFISLKYNKKEILSIIKYTPNILGYDITLIKNRIENLIKIGYNQKQAKSIIVRYSRVLTVKDLNKTINNFINLGYEKSNIIKMCYNEPRLFIHNIETDKERIKDLINIGFTDKQVYKMSINYSHIFSYTMTNINKKIFELESLGFSHSDVIKILANVPHIFGYSFTNIKTKVNNLVKKGISYTDVLKMIVMCPDILTNDVKTINKRINNIILLGFNKKEVNYMITEFPMILTFAEENIKEKILYFTYLGLKEQLKEKPRNLMQGVRLTYARINHLRDSNIIITKDNDNLLYISDKIYQKRFGKSKEELLTEYNYVTVRDEIIDTAKKILIQN